MNRRVFRGILPERRQAAVAAEIVSDAVVALDVLQHLLCRSPCRRPDSRICRPVAAAFRVAVASFAGGDARPSQESEHADDRHQRDFSRCLGAGVGACRRRKTRELVQADAVHAHDGAELVRPSWLAIINTWAAGSLQRPLERLFVPLPCVATRRRASSWAFVSRILPRSARNRALRRRPACFPARRARCADCRAG